MRNLWSKKSGKDQVGVLGSEETTRLIYPSDSPGKNTGVGCHALLQGTFPTQGSNPHLNISCIGKWVLYHWHHLGSLHVWSKEPGNDHVGVY